MLEFIRKRTGSIVVKLLLGLLVVAFGLWGITDVFLAAARKPVAVVGDEKISAEDFHYKYREAQQRMMAATKGKISIQDMIRLKLPEQVLENMVQESLSEQLINKLGLTVSDAFIKSKMQQVPQFNTNGQYDPNKFVRYLRSVGMPERQFLKNLRSSLVQQQIQVPTVAGVEMPESYRRMLYERLMQKHHFMVARIPLNSAKVDKQPSDQELKDFYNKNSSMFKLPELRNISAIVLHRASFADSIEVGDAEARGVYEDRSSEFTTEERRSVIVAKLESFEEAEKIRKKAFGGSLEKVATAEKLEIEKFDSKSLAEIPELYANIATDLAKGEMSEPREGVAGFVLVQVTSVQPAKLMDYSKVKAQIISEIKAEKAQKKMQQTLNGVEDAVSSGMTLAEVANKFPTAKLIEAGNVTVTGLDQDDNEAFKDLSAQMRGAMLVEAFEVEEGQETGTIEADDGVAIAVVHKISPPQIPAFEQAKPKVTKLWLYNERYHMAAKLAKKIVKASKSVEQFKQAVKENGAMDIQTLEPISVAEMSNNKKFLSLLGGGELVQTAFGLTEGSAAQGFVRSSDSNPGGHYIVFTKAIDAVTIKDGDKRYARFRTMTGRLTQKDLAEQEKLALRTESDVETNVAAMEDVVGLTSS